MKKENDTRKLYTVSFRCEESFKEGLERLSNACAMSIGDCIRECVIGYAKTLRDEKRKEQQSFKDAMGE